MKRNSLPVIITHILVVLHVTAFVGCTKKEHVRVTPQKPEVVLSLFTADPFADKTWADRTVLHLHKDTVYVIDANYVRDAGEELIIEEGTLIKLTTASSITINEGAIITANGTPEKPIILTSNARPGTQGPNWGGLIINGRSFNNARGPNGIPDDFSGVLNYVRVEFASVALNGVGSKTVFENIMVSYTNRPAFDPYESAFNINGGTFNARNLVSYACSGPADFFITNGYAGNMQNVLACRHPFFGRTGSDPRNSLAGVFIQNNSTNPVNARPYSNPIISNLTVIGPNSVNGTPAEYLDTNRRAAALITTNSTCFHIRNSVILGFPVSAWYLDDKETAENLPKGLAEFDYSIVQSNNQNKVLYLDPTSYPPYTSNDFRGYILGSNFKNRLFNTIGDFEFENLENYEFGPGLLPLDSAFILTGASFERSQFYNHPYFNKDIKYLGAVGKDNWLQGWTNFKPLKTNYNFPE